MNEYSLFLLVGYGLALFVFGLLWDARQHRKHLTEAGGAISPGAGRLTTAPLRAQALEDPDGGLKVEIHVPPQRGWSDRQDLSDTEPRVREKPAKAK